MFDKLSSRLSVVVGGLTGRGRLTEDNIADTLRQVRMALLEADVALPVVREFIDSVKTRAIGLEVLKSLTPGQALVRVIHEELVRVMGEGTRGKRVGAMPLRSLAPCKLTTSLHRRIGVAAAHGLAAVRACEVHRIAFGR